MESDDGRQVKQIRCRQQFIAFNLVQIGNTGQSTRINQSINQSVIIVKIKGKKLIQKTVDHSQVHEGSPVGGAGSVVGNSIL